MGAWGSAPWENDGAADWFGDLFESTGLAEKVEDALLLDPEGDAEVVRAAAHVLVALGRNFIWPVESLDRHLSLAIARLEAVKATEELRDAPGLVESIDQDLAALRSRLRPPGR